jgi:hypothetical protein
MALCAYCKTKQTNLSEDGSSICLSCAEIRNYGITIQVVLTEALSEATKDADSAFADLTTIIGDIPSALPQPDGAQRIHNVAAKLAVARHKLAEAQTRLTNYLDRGIVPEDLKRSG